MIKFLSIGRGVAVAATLMLALGAAAQKFPSSNDKVPAGWTGPVFKLSQDYPATLPTETQPWQAIDPTKEPQRYVDAVYRYVLEGNTDIDWQVQNNKVRKWYHAPWMHYGDSGREFIHGLTRERTTPVPHTAGKGELGPDQKSCAQNWAVGFFNPIGGYQVGKVWANSAKPDATLSQFPDGTVIAKLLFTAASTTDVKYLKNSFEWQGNINVFPSQTCPSGPLARKPQTVRLLQMDLAVKDSRATETGWVFATMAYNGDAQGATPWERMKPVGVMWGNDLTKGQQWINTGIGTPQHLGFEGRLNGPVDNPKSACMSCHATAQTPAASPMMPPSTDTARWFRNYRGNQPFDAGSVPTDYSLQIAMGIQNQRRAASTPPQGAKTPKLAESDVKLLKRSFDSGRDLPVPVPVQGTLEYPIGR
jgi:hypothetical protein